MLTSILERAYKISIDNYLIETISEYYSEVVTHSFASNEASHRGFKQFLLPLKLSQFFVRIRKNASLEFLNSLLEMLISF